MPGLAGGLLGGTRHEIAFTLLRNVAVLATRSPEP
jgi:hypothetical protein